MKAIVLGASGYLGSAVISELLSQGVSVLALSRKPLLCSEFEDSNQAVSNKACLYNSLVLKDDSLLELANNDQAKEFASSGDCVFFNFAWKGINRLKDGALADQFSNVVMASNAVIVASELGCSKFVHTSSQDEAIFSRFLKEWKTSSLKKEELPYGAAKLAAKEMCLIEAYIHKIDFVNVRFSAVIDKTLNSPSFICANLKKIVAGDEFVIPSNPNPIEINYLPDLARAFVEIAKFGKNKADYYIGQGEPHTLKEYFCFAKAIKDKHDAEFTSVSLSAGDSEIFDNCALVKDTGFKFNYTFKDMVEDLLK